jgi:predicted nucleic acid-binding protein
MLVIDASALVEVLTADPDEIHELAQRIHDAEWMSAPDLIDYEVLNVLRRMVFGGDIDGDLAEAARLTLRDLRLTRYPLTDEMSDRVWQLRHNVSAYDASYVALAEQLDVPVVTADARLARGLQGSTSVKIETYAVEIDPS